MNEPRNCPNCRAAVPPDAPEGVCPACALRAGFDVTVGPDTPTRVTPPPTPGGLSLDELARRLPELGEFELLGQGGMGAVYRARHTELDRPVAVKVLDAALRDDPSFTERFTREARTMAQLDHPNVVRVYDFGHREGLYYLVMELVDGVNLRQTLEAGRLEPSEALAMVPKICEALQYAHDQGVVHRDIKPENILVDRNGSIKIADFGLAKLVRGDRGRRLTGSRHVMGTPNYMAPEQIENPGQVDHRADIFALGVVFYELLTGELPVGRFPLPSQKVQIDVRLDDVVLRTLEKEPSLRYQQASELQSEVESLSRGGPASEDRVDPPTERRRDFEYCSSRTMFGLPLIHIASSRDPEGKRMRVATGIIAIGDMAVGLVALGSFSFGGIAIGGIGIGLFGFGGIAVGLLTALGGMAFGGFAVGGFAAGLIARGAAPFSAFSLSDVAMARTSLVGWLVQTLSLSSGGVAAAWAWIEMVRSGALRRR